MTRKARQHTAPPPDTSQVARLATAVAEPFPDGAKASWTGEDGLTHPVTVRFRCCQASGTRPMYQVVDEFGWGHTVYDDALAPRVDGPDYAPRPAGPRKED